MTTGPFDKQKVNLKYVHEAVKEYLHLRVR